MLVLRPSRPGDLPEIERIAGRSAIGVTSLPANRDRLFDKIRASCDSLDAAATGCGEQSYFLVLEDIGQGGLVGVSGITASAGFSEAFYNYRHETLIHASRELGIHTRIHALSLCHDLTGNTLLTGFYIDPAFEYTDYPDLLSRGRLMLIAAHPQRFAEQIISEMVGISDVHGNSPFWDAVGRRFFGIDYAQAELYCGVKGRSFIADMLPQHPIYVPLLSEQAQEAIGKVHPKATLPFGILLAEGFEAERYIDIFDGGCVVQARTRSVRTIASSRPLIVRIGANTGTSRFLLANTRLADFRAGVASLDIDPQNNEVILPAPLAQALLLADGESLLASPL